MYVMIAAAALALGVPLVIRNGDDVAQSASHYSNIEGWIVSNMITALGPTPGPNSVRQYMAVECGLIAKNATETETLTD